MLLDTLRESNKECTGCSACKNMCPHNAIQMEPDEEGFFKPCIEADKCTECHICEKTCPQLNMKTSNYDNPKCYAVRAEEEILNVSSSGGAFTILADYVFERGGYVCGAAYDEDFKGVSHIMISEAQDMYKLRGSKYVYSKPGDIYKQVKKKLEENKYVLFSGTPCQVAGLNNFLGRNYENLITVDLLCGGVPSEKIFRQYMEEISHQKKIKSVNFRPKKYGWNYSGIETIFEDDTIHMIHSVKDPYLKGFLNWLYVGNSCADCQFASPARQGDFSIGDFWNISRYSEKLDYKDGVSCLLLNNKKGEKIFQEISEKFALSKQIPLSFLRRFNRLQSVRKHHLARPRFFDLIDRGFSVEKAVDYSLGWKFDIALTGCWTVKNYGGELTYFALYNVLKDLNYTTIMVERRKDIPGYDVPKPSLFNVNPYPFYDISRIHKNIVDQKELNARINTFILGSDQVWNYEFMEEDAVKSYTLDYVADYRKKISYATSFGKVDFTGNEEQKRDLKKLIKEIDHLSVREKSGVKIIEDEFEEHAEWVLDPVFLCKKKNYDRLLNNANVCVDGQYIFTYFMHLNDSKLGIEQFASKLGMGLINTVDAGKVFKKSINKVPENWNYPYEYNCKLENWLYYLVNSSYIITDSFHATCLAIIFKKPFVFIRGHLTDDVEGGRLTTILEVLGLEERISDTVQNALKIDRYFTEIDYESVYERLNPEIERSYNWLKKALESDKEL